MAANFNHMAGGMNPMMLMQQQQAQQQQAQQQVQQQPNAQFQQIQASIINTISNQTAPASGWRVNVPVSERYGHVWQLVSQLRLIQQNAPPELGKLCHMAIQFEKQIYDGANDKDGYLKGLQEKQLQLTNARASQAQGLQAQVQQQAQLQQQQQQQAQLQMAQAQQMGLGGQPGMQGQMGRPGMVQQPQQGFQHLQHQMQASPLPGQQQQQQMPMNMGNPLMQQNMNPNNPNFQLAMQQRLQQQQQMQQRGPFNVQATMQQMSQMNQNDQNILNDIAKKLLDTVPPETQEAQRQKFSQSLDQATLMRFRSSNVDPLLMYYRGQALQKMKYDRQQAAQQQAMAQQQMQQAGMPGNVQRPQQQGVPMQQQRSGNPGMAQPQQMAQNADFAQFLGGVENLIGQQQQAGVMAQEAGQMVVPASTNQGNLNSQPGMTGQIPNSNSQRPQSNMTPQQQQIFNMQRQQNNERLNQANQAQLRATAQAKAQQMALQGQPGGMGPMPPQQSPAMGTLNTPIKTPQQPGGVDGQPMNTPGGGHFGQPLNDPRFAHGNQQNGVPGAVNNMGAEQSIFPPNITEEQKQKILSTVPRERLNQGIGPQFNQPNMQNQLMANGQRMASGMPQGLNPQQQLLMQQQMSRLPQQQQQQNAQQAQVQAQMHAQMQLAQQAQAGNTRNQPMSQQEMAGIAKIDNLPIPPPLLQQPFLRIGLPPEVKAWGQLKLWLSQSQIPNAPQILEQVKRLQSQHLRTLLQQRAAGAMANGMPMNPGQQPQAPPGLSAPGAPAMPGQMNGMPQMNIAALANSITGADVARARAHSSGRFAGLGDDEIRQMLMKNQIMNQQRNRQQALAQQQGGMQMQVPQNPMQQIQQPQLNQGLQRTPGQQVPQMQQLNIHQQQQQLQKQQQQQQQQQQQLNKPQQQPQQTPRQQPNAETLPNAANARAGKGTQAKQPAISPPQGQKNLKRSSSEDVVEIQNPNSQQNNKQGVQQQKPNRPVLTPAQVAQLTPEQRQQYEAKLRAHQQQTQQALQQQQQQGGQQKPAVQQVTQEEFQRCQQLMKEEMSRSVKYPELQMSDQEIQAVRAKMQQTLPNFIKVRQILAKWYSITHNEDGVRRYWRLLIHMQNQFMEPNKLSGIKPKLSISLKDITEAYQFAQSIMQDMVAKFPEFQKAAPGAQKSAQAGPQQAPAPQTTAQAQSMPLNAANLQQQQQALNKQGQKMHQRSNSRSSHVPAAPTSAHPPPFPNSSEHTVPKYFTKTELTQDNLRLPTAKRPRHSANSTPQLGNQTPGSTSSPQVIKAGSPEQKKQTVADQPMQDLQQPKLMCPEGDCDHHFVDGFDKPEDLEKHRVEEHINALRDPQQYVLNELGQILDLEADGSAKRKAEEDQQTADKPKTGNTPAATTPMNKDAGAPGSKAEKTEVDALNDVLDDILWSNASVNPMDLMHNFQGLESGANGAISDMTVYRSITPNDTPESSKSNDTNPVSDISEGMNLNINIEGLMDDSWAPFGTGVGDIDDYLKINLDNNDDLNSMFNDYPQYNNDFKNWDDLIDPKAMEGPFALDTSLFGFKDQQLS